MRNEKIFIDLFAGAGGLSEGFIRAGYKPIAHVEIDKAASNTLKTRMARHWLYNEKKYSIYEDYLHGRITRTELWDSVPKEIIESVINIGIGEENNHKIFNKISELNDSKIDLIIGGPPCQAYSIAGRSRDKQGMKGDERNYLYKYYAEFLREYKPKYFVFENVLGLLSAKDSDGELYYDKMKILFKECGYDTKDKILDASEHGIPQKRKRIILVGKLNGIPEYPMPEFTKMKCNILELFEDLPSINAGEGTHFPAKYMKNNEKKLKPYKLRNNNDYVTWHVSRPNRDNDLEIYRLVAEAWNSRKERLKYNELPDYLKFHKNKTSHLDRFKVVAGDLPYSHTVVAHISKDGHYYIHPNIYQNRSITPREAARLQTFPDDYYFEGENDKPSRTAAFKQIGNAVPVLLGEKIAVKLNELW